MITQLKFASVPVQDQDRALAFYTEKLGFKVATDQRMSETQRWIELMIPGAQTRIVLFTPQGHEDRVGSFSGLSFVCDNVEKSYDEMLKKGVEFEAPPRAEPWGTFAIFRDSEGNSFVMGTK